MGGDNLSLSVVSDTDGAEGGFSHLDVVYVTLHLDKFRLVL